MHKIRRGSRRDATRRGAGTLAEHLSPERSRRETQHRQGLEDRTSMNILRSERHSASDPRRATDVLWLLYVAANISPSKQLPVRVTPILRGVGEITWGKTLCIRCPTGRSRKYFVGSPLRFSLPRLPPNTMSLSRLVKNATGTANALPSVLSPDRFNYSA